MSGVRKFNAFLQPCSLVTFLQHLARKFPLSWFLNLFILVPQARLSCLQLFTTLHLELSIWVAWSLGFNTNLRTSKRQFPSMKV